MVREYFTDREKSNVPQISIRDFAYSFYAIFKKYANDQYFEQLGISGWPPNSTNLDTKIKNELAIAFSRKSDQMVPTIENVVKLNRKLLFNLIEFLSDNVATPYIAVYREAINIDADLLLYEPAPSAEDRAAGLKAWCNDLNQLLGRLDPPYKLTLDRNIVTLPPSAGLRSLIDNYASPTEDSQQRIKYACTLFLKHNSTKNDKYSSLKHLADILESERHLLKKHVKQDANRLFEIANEYGIRHYNDKQKRIDNVYLLWIFYSFLSAIDLVSKLKTRAS